MFSLRTLFSRSTYFKPTTSAYKIRSRHNVTTHQQRPLAQSISGANPFNLNAAVSPIFNSEPESYDYYSGIRIYRNHSWYDLTNVILMTTCCNNDFFVSNCHKIYEMSHKVLGSKLTEFAVANTMGRIYTSGNSLQAMENFIQNWRHPGVNILMSFSNEAPPHLVNTRVLDENARAYADSVDLCSKANQNNNAMALKCSSLCLLSTLKNSTKAQLELRSIFSSGFSDLSQQLTAKEIEDLFLLRNIQFTFSEFQEFMSLFLNKEVTKDNLDQVFVTKFDWLKDMHMYYVNDSQKNKNKILRQLAKINQEDMEELERFAERLKLIFDRGYNLKQRILVDAEQSYMQFTIDSFAVQFSNIYNQETAIILNTFQNYLKSTKDRILYELERCKSLGLPFGVKMVRGAYMVEERRIAQENGYEDPIQPSIEDTHNNYNSNLELLISNWVQNSQVLIASHNEHSVKWGKYLVKKYDINHTKGFLSFAQLLGLGDHLTFSLSKEGYTVGKMCHFGPLPYMVPFLIRRAQESRQVLASSALKRRLAFNEISQRIRFTSN